MKYWFQVSWLEERKDPLAPDYVRRTCHGRTIGGDDREEVEANRRRYAASTGWVPSGGFDANVSSLGGEGIHPAWVPPGEKPMTREHVMALKAKLAKASDSLAKRSEKL